MIVHCMILFFLLQSYSYYFSFSTFHISSLVCTTYMHLHLPLYFYTHIESSGSLDLQIQFYSYFITFQVFGEDHKRYEKPRIPLFDYWYSYFLLFCHFLDSRYNELITCFIFLSICYYVRTLYILL